MWAVPVGLRGVGHRIHLSSWVEWGDLRVEDLRSHHAKWVVPVGRQKVDRRIHLVSHWKRDRHVWVGQLGVMPDWIDRAPVAVHHDLEIHRERLVELDLDEPHWAWELRVHPLEVLVCHRIQA